MARCIVVVTWQEWPEMGKIGEYSSILAAYFSQEISFRTQAYYVVSLDTGELLSWDAVELRISREILISIVAGDGIPSNIPNDTVMYLLKIHGLIENDIITEDGKQLLAKV